MEQLPREVLDEFKKGNFVVKWSVGKFNEVSPDHSLEWLNGIGKRGGGIVGITKTSSALSRWALSYNLRSEIAEHTRTMFGLEQEDTFSEKESVPGRMIRNNKDEEQLCAVLKQYNVFSLAVQPDCLYNIATKDLVTDTIQLSLLSAKDLGQRKANEFVEERLVIPVQEPGQQGVPEKPMVQFTDTMHKNNAATFDTLYQVDKRSKEKEKNSILRADRSVLQRLIVAYESGRTVNLLNVLSYELMPVPVSLAEMNGRLRTGQKALLADTLTKGVGCPNKIDLPEGSRCLLIDGMALVVALGRPSGAQTFEDFADHFQEAVVRAGAQYQQIHVIFDRYLQDSVKSGTRERRTRTTRPIRRVIESGRVPLPHSWPNFLALPENKSDLARFLSTHLITNAPKEKVIVVAGGFVDGKEVQSTDREVDVSALSAAHEEADTRLILHCFANSCDTVVVSARDTDVLLLLVAHAPNIPSTNIWMMAGTSKKRKFFNIRAISRSPSLKSLPALFPFHALTGCDTTSFICNHSKVSAWKIFLEHYNLLLTLGEGELTEENINNAEQFVCRMYKCNNLESVDQARVVLFSKSGNPEALPPTKDALLLHIKRTHYQALVWKQACCQEPSLPDPDGMGWTRNNDNKLQPLLMTKEPIPKACKEIVTCSCRTGCTTLRCSCQKSKLFCTSGCGCNDNNACKNTRRK